MKTIITFLAKRVYLFFFWLDRVTGHYESYSYETAPYCGHAYHGHKGYFTASHFHESDGGGATHGWFHRYILGAWYSNVDGDEYGFSVPLYRWCRWFYYELKRYRAFFVVKLEYPHGKRTLYIRTVKFRPSTYKYTPNPDLTLHVIRLNRWFFPVSHSTI